METAVDLLGDLCEVFAILLLRTLISAGVILVSAAETYHLMQFVKIFDAKYWKLFEPGGSS